MAKEIKTGEFVALKKIRTMDNEREGVKLHFDYYYASKTCKLCEIPVWAYNYL